MSAPSIPNLLSLRGSRGGGRGGGRNRGRGGGSGGGLHPPPSPSSAAAAAAGRDAVIQGTDTDAAVSRMSAVDLGYLDDPFAQFFVQRPTVGQATRRLPIINRGTYARTAALDRLISSFLRGGGGEGGGGKRQIVSLGAGTDTRVFRLFGPQAQPPQTDLIYHEIDFPAVAAKKLQLVRAVPPLRNIVPDPASVPITTTTSEDPNDENGTRTATNSTTCWSSGGGSGELPNGCEYWCHGRDLRDLVRPGAPPLRGLRRDVPTLLVSECCLCYLEAAQSRAVIEYFAGSGEGAGTAGIADLAVVLYEPIRPDDAFGRQMVANLAARRIRMPSLDAYGTAAAQTARLRAAGFEGGAEARTVEDVWREWVPDGEKERVDGLEGLDEVEEWNLLAAHYVVAWGWRGRGFEGWEGGGGGAG